MDENENMFFFLLKQLTIQTFYLMSPHLQCNNVSQLKFKQEIYFSPFMILYMIKNVVRNRKIVNKTKNKQKTKNKNKNKNKKTTPPPPKNNNNKKLKARTFFFLKIYM